MLERARASWTRAAKWTDVWGPRLVGEPWASLAFLVPALVAFGYALAVVAVRVWYECLGPYNVDSPIYWAIGHGIIKGYAPYRDLWDIKPPGIFLLSALSYLTTGGPWLTHVTQVLALILVALSPMVYLRRLESRGQALRAAPVVLSLWTLVLMLTAFTDDNAGTVQTESHALPAIAAYTLLVGVAGRRPFWGRAIAIMVAIGLKEPFLLAVPVAYLIIDPEARRPWEDFWGPLLLAAGLGTLFLLVVGWLWGFVGLYLRSMMGSHVNVFGSPWGRIFGAYDLIWDRLRKYSLFLPLTLTYCCGTYLLGATSSSAEGAPGDGLARRFQVLVFGVLLSSLAVGMTGYFYDHHYVLIVPFCLAVIFSLLSKVIPPASARSVAAPQPWLRAGLVPLALLVALFPDWVPVKTFRDSARNLRGIDARAHEAAEVIDAVLDRLHLERYLWLGPGGFPPWTYTRHVPSGPLFFQQIIFFDGHYPKWLATRFRAQLEAAKIIVFDQHIAGPLDAEVKAKLARDFVPLPARLVPPGKHSQWPIFIRKGVPIP